MRESTPSAFWDKFLNEEGENGSAGPAGKSAVGISRFQNSSFWSVGDRAGEDLVVKKEKRLVRPGLGVLCAGFVVGGMAANGSDFSFVGDGRIPMLIGDDSPLNQPASLLEVGSFLTISVWSAVNKGIERRFSRVGVGWGDLWGDL